MFIISEGEMRTFPIRTTVGTWRPRTQWAAVRIYSSDIIDPPQLKS